MHSGPGSQVSYIGRTGSNDTFCRVVRLVLVVDDPLALSPFANSFASLDTSYGQAAVNRLSWPSRPLEGHPMPMAGDWPQAVSTPAANLLVSTTEAATPSPQTQQPEAWAYGLRPQENVSNKEPE